MAQSYDLTQLDAHSFEHMINFLALKVLGNGVTGFTAGPDGGRDGYMRGKANYPSSLDNWSGTWYIQSKFHKPHLSKNPQKWLIEQVSLELEKFESGDKSSTPNNWIIATNIEPSGSIKTGSYDKIIELVNDFDSNIKVDIWGGRKVLDFLHSYPEVATTYGHFLTPGHVITELNKILSQSKNNINSLIEHLLVNQFLELSYTKLEQAGSINDNRPKIYELFRDLPIQVYEEGSSCKIMNSLVSASGNVQKISTWEQFGDGWESWAKNPNRSRITLLKGGPGQGKSTAGQYFSQIQRAAFILSDNGPKVSPQIKSVAKELKQQAMSNGFWPSVPRIPLFVELKDFANWYINRGEFEPKNIVSYLCHKINIKTGQSFMADSIHEALNLSAWFVNFDGLDEVPNDVKDDVANEIIEFSNELIPRLDADVLILCTTRPQGYSGQFDSLYASNATLLPLPPDIALECATAVVRFNREQDEYQQSIAILKSAMGSEQVRELMTTPLQSHIMAVVVRDGGRPPEKRWELFNNFYAVMKKRESLKNFPDLRITTLLIEQDQLLKSIHDRLGISLHAKAENSAGAEANLNKEEFKKLASQCVAMQFDTDIEEQVDVLMEATTERLVFVNTPESSDSVRFDIRQLQEFFAAEFMYNAVENSELDRRLNVICGDAHWREIVHFILSALIHHKRLSELSVAINIIQSIDDDNQNHHIRSFKKKMGSGSLFCLRLLEEGMLEQDKRIRQQFTNCLPPLWNMLDHDVLSKILNIKKENSKAWILNNLINSFLEVDYAEHISAGYILTSILDKEHSRINEVKEKVLHAPDYYILATLKLHTDNPRKSSTINIQDWFFDMVINYIFDERYNNSVIQKESVNFIYTNGNSLSEFIGRNEIDDEKTFILNALVKKDEKINEPNIDQMNYNPYCFFSLSLRKKNWFDDKNSQILERFNFMEKKRSSSINLLIAFLNFDSDRSIDNFRNIVESFVANNFDSFIVPNYLKALLPFNIDEKDSKESILKLNTLNNDEISASLRDYKKDISKLPAYIHYFQWSDEPYEENKWKALCNDFPELCLSVISGNGGFAEEIEKAQDKNPQSFFKPILDLAYKNPKLFSAHFFSWNKLFNAFPSHKDDLKDLLVSNIDLSNFKHSPRISIQYPFFEIDKVKHKKALIIFANALFITSSRLSFSKMLNIRLSVRDFSQRSIESMGLDNEYLLERILDKDENPDIRVACSALLLCQISHDRNRMQNILFDNYLDDILLSLISKDTVNIITNTIFILCYNLSTYDDNLMIFLGKFSNIVKNDYFNRIKLQNIFLRLRERSFAPVSQHNCLGDWLNYSY